MKKGYHSTQRKIWGSIPASEFYGFVLGYAVAWIIKGLFKLDVTLLPLVLGVIGVSIGIWVDVRFYSEKDEPPEAPKEDADDHSIPEGASTQETLRAMFERNRDGGDD